MNTVQFLRVMFAGVLALLALASPHATSAAGKEVFRYSYQGQSSTIYFATYDGCIGGSTYLHAVDGRVKTEGRPQADTIAYISFWQYNHCTYSEIDGWAYVELDADAFRINNHLNSATLNTTIQVNDYWSGASFPVTLNLTLEGVGDLTHSKSRSQYDTPAYRSTYRTDMRSRSAVIAGTVTTPYGTFDISQSSVGRMQAVKAAEMTLHHQ